MVRAQVLTIALLAALTFAGAPARADFEAGFAAYSQGDYETALREWRSLAEAGDSRAQVGLGFMHEKGLGVPQDHTKAVRWYRLGSEQGDPIAEYNLAVMYGNGTGVLRDYVKAFALFSLSADHGNKEAEGSLAYIERLMTPTEIAEARDLLATAGADGAAAARLVLNDGDTAVAATAPVASPDAVATGPADAATTPQLAPVPEPVPEPAVAAAPPPVEPPVEQAVEQAVERTVEQAVEPAGERPVEQAAAPAIAPPVVEPVAAGQASADRQQAAPAPAAQVAIAAPPPVSPPPVSPSPAIAATDTPPDTVAAVASEAGPLPRVAAAPAETAATPTAAPVPWRVHMASLRSEQAAITEWERLKQRHAGLEGMKLTVETIDLPEKGRFYRVLAGPIVDKSKADDLCAALAATDQYCRALR